MKVLVTGGTGLVGSHAAAAIARGGHELRLLVRRPEQVTASLGPLGLEVTDVVVGDVLDEHVVSQAVEGCEAVVHAAAVSPWTRAAPRKCGAPMPVPPSSCWVVRSTAAWIRSCMCRRRWR